MNARDVNIHFTLQKVLLQSLKLCRPKIIYSSIYFSPQVKFIYISTKLPAKLVRNQIRTLLYSKVLSKIRAYDLLKNEFVLHKFIVGALKLVIISIDFRKFSF